MNDPIDSKAERRAELEADYKRMRAAIREVWDLLPTFGLVYMQERRVTDLLRPFVEGAKGPEHTRNILLGAVKEYYEGASSEVSEAVPPGGERIPGPADNAADGDQCPCSSVLKSGVKRRCTLVNAHFGLHLWERDEHIPCGRYGTCGPWSVRCSLPLGHDGDHACREQMTDGSPIWDAHPGVPEITLPDPPHEVEQAEAAPCGAECNFRHCKTMCKRVGDHDVCYCPAHGKIVERDMGRTVIRESVGSLLVPMATQLADLTARVNEHGKRIDGIKERVVQLGQNLDASALLRMADRVAEVEQRLTAVEQCHNEGETIALFEHHKQQVNALVGRLDRRMEWLASALPRHFSVPVDNLASARPSEEGQG